MTRDAYAELFTDEAVQEFPYAPAHYVTKVVGRDPIADYIVNVVNGVKNWNFKNFSFRLQEVEKEKLVLSRKDKKDEHKRRLLLSPKGEKLVEKLEPIWLIMKDASTAIITDNDNLLNAIEEAEEALEKQDFFRGRLL